MTRMLLVRHGQSTWNEARRWQGQADPPLTELGEHQAFTAARSIGTVDAIFSSTLERAQSTAQIISNQLGVGPIASIEGLRERNAGDWQGLTRTEIEDGYPGYLARGERPPGWEPDQDLAARVFGALDAICQVWPDGDVVVVTHGGVIYQVEQGLGAEFERISNLGARWVNSKGTDYSLGERIALLPDEELTIPDQI